MSARRARLRRLGWIVAIGSSAVALLYVVGFAVITIGDNDKYGKVGVPGEGRVELEEGTVVIHYEARANLPENSTIDVPDGLVVRVQETGKGERLKFEDGSHISSYAFGSLDGTSVWKAEVPRSGTYAVVTSVGPGAPYADKAITFGPYQNLGVLLLRAAILIAVGLAIAGVLWLIAGRMRTPPPAAPASPTPPASPSPPQGFRAEL